MVKERPDLKPLVGQKLTVIAWLWVRTVKSPNPALAQVDVPLASTFMLSTKAGKEAYVEPVIENGGYHFTVKVGKPKNANALRNGTRAGKAQDFLCLLSGVPIPRGYIREEGKARRLGSKLMAIVAESEKGRIFLSPLSAHEEIALSAENMPTVEEARNTFLSISTPTRAMITGGVCSAYGLATFGDLFTARQLAALTTFSGLVTEVRERVEQDARIAGLHENAEGLDAGGSGTRAYADAIAVYLALAIDRMANTICSIARWTPERQQTVTVFARQAIPMTWDFPDVNPFAGAAGDYEVSVDGVIKGMSSTIEPPGYAKQVDASVQNISRDKLVSTDPPYYDNVGYGDLSDFFYVWLRNSLRPIFPDLFATVAAPKAQELIATRFRHGSQRKAELFFLGGMTQAMQRLAKEAHPAFPITIYYAFKQAESDGVDGMTNTGWDTFLAAVMEAGFAITGTWPMRTELSNRMIGSGTNALASSIILVCRPRPAGAPAVTRREFVTALKNELPTALGHLQRGNIAPVDLAQAAIGPGMAVYTRYSQVLDAEGKPLTVRDALALINQMLDEVLAEQEGDFDADSRWALTWFEHSGFAEGEFGLAEQLSKSKNTSVQGMKDAGILDKKSRGGKVRLLKPRELSSDWDPATDPRLTAWEIVHQLIRVLASGGEGAAAGLVAKLGAKAEIARELAYRLYTLCERKKRATEALAYNGLVQSWPEIARLAREGGKPKTEQAALFEETKE
jgi:putative DNA methylase